MRAPRELCRRRPPLRRPRADRWAPGHQTHSQDHRPALGTTLASKATRAGVAARLAAAAVQQTIAVARGRSTDDEARRTALARASLTTAKPPDAPTLPLGPTVPGMGTILSRGLRDARHDRRRVPRVPACAAAARLGHGSQEAAGTR
jgi:hypothetical protein